ncbi:MAG: hypothetical protein M3173_01855 [Chloroflexota bacterium]|nr:hypothetical protein [Chloroflexota bacterium]
MIKRPDDREGEPIDKAFERLRQFEDARRPQTPPPDCDDEGREIDDVSPCEQEEHGDEKPTR